MILELLGLLGTTLYAVACVPLAYQALRTRQAAEVPGFLSWTLFIANVCFSIYLFASFGVHVPFFLVLLEVVCWGVILWMRYFPSR